MGKALEDSLVYVAHLEFIEYLNNKGIIDNITLDEFEKLLLNKETIRLVINKLRSEYEKEMKEIDLSFSYSGSGDSGNTDFNNDKLIEFFPFTTDKLVDAIDYDWYNNDGGEGEVTFNLFDFHFDCDGVYFTTSSVDASNSLDFEELISEIN